MLVHEPSKRIVLNMQNPAKVTTVIPSARTFTYRGRTLVAVPHRLDEVRVLRNMGIRAPSPIKHRYDWPRAFSYEPFFAQLETAEFLTLNPKAFVLNDMGCVDSETEYLSPTGWVRIADYSGGQVAQYHPNTGAAEFVEPTQYVKLPCPDMIRFKTKYGIDQLLSPEHRMLIETRTGDNQETVSAAEMLARQHAAHTKTNQRRVGRIGWVKAAIPATYVAPTVAGLDLSEALIRVQVAVMADGYFPNKSHTCIVRLKRQRKIDRLTALLTDAGIEFKVVPCQPEGFQRFSFRAPWRTKEYGDAWWAANIEQLKVIADEVLHWDGHVSGRRRLFSTGSKKSADFVQHVFSATGSVARVVGYERNGVVEYTVNIRSDGKPLQLAGADSCGRPKTNAWVEPSTDGFKYCFMVPSTYLLFRRNGCVFASGNTGKTLASLWAFDYLRSIRRARKVLIISPLSTLERTWADEIFRNFPHLTFSVIYGAKERRQKLLEQDVDCYIINHHGIKTVERELLAMDFDTVIVDEIATFRNHSTQLFKSLSRVLAGRERVWGLTGTPTPNSPTDAWAQCRLICPDRVPRYFGAWRDQVMKQFGQFKWLPRDGATARVADAMQPAIRFTRDQCVDLPPVIYQTRHAAMTADQDKAYRDMMRELTVEYGGDQVQAVNEAVKVSKLMQIACGAVYGKDGTEIVLPVEPRMKVVREVIEEAATKVSIFVPFKSVLREVARDLEADFNVATISGDTPKAERDHVFASFQNDPNGVQILVAQPAAMSHGLTLTAAATVIWYSATNSNETYEQANARITRPGQKHTQVIVNIEGSKIERLAFARLRTKQKMQGILLDTVKDAGL